MQVLVIFSLNATAWAGALTDNGALVMGSGHYGSPEAVLRAFRKMGFDPERVDVEDETQGTAPRCAPDDAGAA